MTLRGLYHSRIFADYILLIKNPFVSSIMEILNTFNLFFSISPGDHCGSWYTCFWPNFESEIGNGIEMPVLVLYLDLYWGPVCVIVAWGLYTALNVLYPTEGYKMPRYERLLNTSFFNYHCISLFFISSFMNYNILLSKK